jgi:hypothetical protein
MPGFVQGLNGSDKALYDVLSPEWSCRFLPILLRDHRQELPEEAYETSYFHSYDAEFVEQYRMRNSTFSKQVYSFTMDDLHYLAVSHLPILRSRGRQHICMFWCAFAGPQLQFSHLRH